MMVVLEDRGRPEPTAAQPTCHENVVRMSEILLSSLIKENLQPGGDKEGFLFGSSTVSETRVDSDSHSNQRRRVEAIAVSDFLACGRVGEFYNSAGQLCTDKLKTLLEEDQGSLVGWYRFRRGTPPRPALREAVVHRELCGRRQRGHSLVLLLMTETTDQDTLRHKQAAFVLSGSRLSGVRLEVANVGETASGEYRAAPFSNLGLLLPAATSSSEDTTTGSVSAAVAAQSSAHEHLQTLLQRLIASEGDVSAAHREVCELELQVSAAGAAQ